MFGLGTEESLLLILLLMTAGTGVSRWATRRKVTQINIGLDHITPVGVQARAHDLIEAGRYYHAVKLIRKESQASLRTAVEVANVLRDGGVLPGFPVSDQGDLSAQVRALIAAGSRKEAVFLVRTTEDMSQAEAEAFVDSLPPQEPTP
ncbi:hypothetical protein ACI2LC_11995 [Nonomuraea wenchangensis]|uniref:hypothetical protein n=1 Tax=Nonomuraea wenchangensis TaxID=568860 RepID=UPI0034082A0B